MEKAKRKGTVQYMQQNAVNIGILSIQCGLKSSFGKDGPEMFCSLCQNCNEVPKCMVWTVIPCKFFRKDKLREHEKSQLHQNSVEAETNALPAQRTGGISACLEEQVSLRRQAVKAVFKCAYWLAKEETAHHTKFHLF